MPNVENNAQTKVKQHLRLHSLLSSIFLTFFCLWLRQLACFRQQQRKNSTVALSTLECWLLLQHCVAGSWDPRRPRHCCLSQRDLHDGSGQINGTRDKFSWLNCVNKDGKGLCSQMTVSSCFFPPLFLSPSPCSAIRILFLLHVLHRWIAACYLQLLFLPENTAVLLQLPASDWRPRLLKYSCVAFVRTCACR